MAKKKETSFVYEKKKLSQVVNRTDRLISEHRYNLTFDQQEFLEQNKNCTDLLKITRECFKDDLLDEQSDEFSNVRKFLTKTRRDNQAYNFSEDQIATIVSNGPIMKPMEIARFMFPEDVGPLAKEAQTIAALCKALDVEYEGEDSGNEDAVGEYVPPKSDHKVIAKINKADINANYYIAKLDQRKKECIASLKRNLHSRRFVVTANALRRKALRDFFEEEFVRSTYDKPDLNADETNAYISLCNEYVAEIIIREQISNLNDRLNENVADSDDGKKFTMTLTEALTTKTKEVKECRDFIHKLQKDLSGSRKDRVKEMSQLNESLAKFIQLAQSEKGRKEYLRIQEARNVEIGKEIKKIENHDDLISEIYGMSSEEILNY